MCCVCLPVAFHQAVTDLALGKGKHTTPKSRADTAMETDRLRPTKGTRNDVEARLSSVNKNPLSFIHQSLLYLQHNQGQNEERTLEGHQFHHPPSTTLTQQALPEQQSVSSPGP